jgi:MraZ protein
MELRTGTFESTLDDKGRVSVPIRLRDRYAGDLVIAQGLPPSISAWVMTSSVWNQVLERVELSLAPLAWPEFQLVRQQFMLSAQPVEFDKTGRIAIPPTIRKYAGLLKECLVLSDEDHLEIWDSKRYYDHLYERQPMIIEETIEKLGILRPFGPTKGEKGTN